MGKVQGPRKRMLTVSNNVWGGVGEGIKVQGNYPTTNGVREGRVMGK